MIEAPWKKFILYAAGIALLGALVWGGVFAWKNFKGVGSAFRSPAKDITELIPDSTLENVPEAVNQTDFPLKLPKGFAISIFAKNLPGARVMAFDPVGNMWVSQTSKGVISQLEIKDGQVVKQNAVFKNLNRPHGLIIDGNNLYFAEENQITQVALYSDDLGRKIADLPAGGRHYTRTLLFGADNRLYVSIGSTCDVCHEKDERVAAIYSLNPDGSDFKPVARGLRNSVFMATDPNTGKIWATEMGRDNLGDDLPPDEINIIEDGKNFGWPICYGKNIHDTNFDPEGVASRPYGASNNPCENKSPSYFDLPAHSAPLGLAFIPKAGWPEDFEHNLIVAFHGSWNRSEPTGYKLARIKLDARGNPQGIEDFVSGWLPKEGNLPGGGALGRPVDIIVQPGGIMYVSDDKAGVIYKIQYLPSQTAKAQVLVDSIKENQLITSPLKIIGQAKGNWFFEASFPIRLLDAEGKEIAVAVAQANPPAGGDWMTEKFVPFEATINFSPSEAKTGWLVFKKDNPSGLKEHDGEVRLPVRFKN